MIHLRTAFTPETIQAVQDMQVRDRNNEKDDLDTNTCGHSELGLSPATFSRIIKHHLHFHCYKYVNI